MVSIIENYATVEGDIVEVTDHPRRPGYLLMKLALKKSKPLEGFPNLAAADEGSTISIVIKKDAKEAAVTRQRDLKRTFSATVKKAAGQEYFIR
jgi:hypothetical protein